MRFLHGRRSMGMAALFAVLAPCLWAADIGPSRPVTLYFNVEDGDHLITGLAERNFILREEGEPRSFRLEQAEKPAVVALLVEYSRSSWLYLNDIHAAINAFLNAAPQGHWYAVATFAQQLEIVVDFTQQKGDVLRALQPITPSFWREINTYDAVWQMLNMMEPIAGRKILIFVGSGADTFSARSLGDIKKRVERSEVVIYALGAGSLLRGQYSPYLGSSARLSLLQAEAFLNMLAGRSGGQAWFPRFETAFPGAMKGVMQMIETHYKLVYRSQLPADGKFHKIKMEAFVLKDDRRTDYAVRVREGWRFPPTDDR